MDFGLLGFAGTPTQCGCQPPFETRDGTLDLRPLTVLDLGEPTVHLAAILGLGPAATAPFVQRDDCAADTKLLASEGMIMFGIVTGVSQQAVDGKLPRNLFQQRCPKRRVLARTIADQHVNQQMRGVVAGQRQLRPVSHFVTFLAGSPSIMRGAVSRVEPRRIDAGFFLVADQPLGGCVPKDSCEQLGKPIFFSIRC